MRKLEIHDVIIMRMSVNGEGKSECGKVVRDVSAYTVVVTRGNHMWRMTKASRDLKWEREHSAGRIGHLCTNMGGKDTPVRQSHCGGVNRYALARLYGSR